jgi:hypothetical protein
LVEAGNNNEQRELNAYGLRSLGLVQVADELADKAPSAAMR